MARQKLSDRPVIVIHAKKLKEIAQDEGIAYRTAQRRKDKYAQVVIHFGENSLRNKENKGELRTQIRYLDSKTTELLRASGLFIS
jgi:hypothetical protein